MNDVELSTTSELAVWQSVEDGVDSNGRPLRVDVLICTGEVDIVSEPEFRKGLERLESLHAVVDLGGVTFIGAAGINALIDAAARRGTDAGTLVLRDEPFILRRVLSVLDLPNNLILDEPATD